MNTQGLPMGEKGIAAILGLLAFAAIAVAAAGAYWLFVSKQTPSQSSIPIMDSSSQTSGQASTVNCLDTDYTGCDTSADFMTWKDDGVRNPPSSKSTIISK